MMDNTAAFYRYIARAKLAERACKPTAARQHLANAARLAPTLATDEQVVRPRTRKARAKK